MEEDDDTETPSDSDVDYSSDEALERSLKKRLSSSPEKINSSQSEESPRTRSRGNVKINLWTLDVNPVLPGEKPTAMSRKQIAQLREQGIDIPTDGEAEDTEGGCSRSGSFLMGDEDAYNNSEQVVDVGARKQGIVEGLSTDNINESNLAAVNGDILVEGAQDEGEVVIAESVESRETKVCASMEVSNYLKTTLPTPLNNGSNGPTHITLENGTQ